MKNDEIITLSARVPSPHYRETHCLTHQYDWRKLTVKQLFILGAVCTLCVFLALAFVYFIDMEKHPDKYRDVELYYVKEYNPSDKLYTAINEHGTVAFRQDNVQGDPVRVGDTVAISLLADGTHPLVELYDLTH